MLDDSELLRRFAEEKAEDAFAELVRRRIDLVYSVALRHLAGDTHLAEDVTQQVFVDLARKAASLSRRLVLTGWLYRSAQFAASRAVRAESRRRAREQEAERMKENQSDAMPIPESLRALLDEGLSAVGDEARDAIALRFFESKSYAEIGRILRVTEDAARKRVDRSLEKLEMVLRRRGVDSTAAAVAAALGTSVAFSAPATLVTTTVAAGVGAASAGSVISAAFLAMTKFQLSTAAAVALAGTLLVFEQVGERSRIYGELDSLRNSETETAGIRQQHDRLQRALSEAELGSVSPETLARMQETVEALRHQRAANVAMAAIPSSRIDVRTVPTLEAEQLSIPPAPRFRLAPLYPPEMRRQRISGEVLVEFVVDANGEMRDVHAIKATRPEFESAALDAVRLWEFRPGQIEQGRVNARVRVPMVFTVSGQDMPVPEPIYPAETGLPAFQVSATPLRVGEKPAVAVVPWF